MKQDKKQKGFIQIIIIVIIALALLKYVFDFDIFEFLGRARVKETIDYIWNDIIVFLWKNYLAAPAIWAWNTTGHLAKIGWENLILLLDKIKEIVTIAKS